jgi:SAM-dependent methyltransferase
MDDHLNKTYGKQMADVYDQWFLYEPEAIELLAELARHGSALELGIGTGRMALPLAAKGVEVHGIDASPAMVEKLRERPGSESINVTMGNFADVNVDGKFTLVFIVFNTFFALLTQDEQVRCFRNVAQHLNDDGVFLIEAFVPDVARFSSGPNLRIYTSTQERVSLQAAVHDPVQQRMFTQNIVFTGDATKLYPVEVRYAWPSELDLMAQLAGLQLRSRWSNWKRETFTAASEKHISVYERRSEEVGKDAS